MPRETSPIAARDDCPLVAVVLAAGVGLTVSWHIALYAAVLLVAIRLFEDHPSVAVNAASGIASRT